MTGDFFGELAEGNWAREFLASPAKVIGTGAVVAALIVSPTVRRAAVPVAVVSGGLWVFAKCKQASSARRK